MKNIRTKPTIKAPRVLSEAVRIPKELLHKIHGKAEDTSGGRNEQEESPQQYAENRIQETAQRSGRKAKEHGKQAIRKIRDAVKKNTPSQTTKTRANSARRSARSARHAAKRTVKTTAKRTVKSVRHTVKTARNTVKASRRAVRTAKAAVKTAKMAAKAAQMAVRAARAAAKAAVTAAKTAAKITMAIVKAVIAAVKALVAAIAAGGWVVLLVILIVVVVIILVVFLMGIFFADESGGLSVSETAAQVNEDFRLAIDTQISGLSAGGDYDKVNIIYDGNMDGDSDAVNNWRDILIVFSGSRMANGEPSIELTEESLEELRHIFYAMNTVSYRTEVVQDTEQGNILNIYVTIDNKTWQEGAELFAFDKNQMQIAEELARPDYYPLFAELLGTDIYGGMTNGEMTDIISGLPQGTKGTVIVQEALTRLGHPYSQPLRGQGDYVDCSYLTWWAYKQAGIDIPTTSVEQARYCQENGRNVGRSELQPGDLVFWSKTTCGCGRWNEIHHVGIYAGNNQVIEASNSKGCVVIQKLWGLDGGKWQVYSFARPDI